MAKSGTGIGLYQSQKFAKKLGFAWGTGIQVQSEWKKGSTFSFVIENKVIKDYHSNGPSHQQVMEGAHTIDLNDHLSKINRLKKK